MIEKAPDFSNEVFMKAMRHASRIDIQTLLNEINDKYLYWSDVKYQKKPTDISVEELWAITKFNRGTQRLVIWPEYGVQITITNEMQRLCHYFDMNFGGTWGNNSVIPEANNEQYLISSLMEEAISSSQMEGASTTRRVAKDMLRKSISPQNRSEQMISNNYNSIKYIIDHKNESLTEEMFLHIHALMTYKTLDNTKDEGRFRDDDNVVVENGITHETVHTPPSYKEIPQFVKELCDFANNCSKGKFVHPIIKAILIHFMIAYMHPFVDGNGRTARAMFYWYMLKNGYWLTEYLSISRIIYRSKASYEKAYLYTEADGNDAGYFITYHLHVLNQAFLELQSYIKRKIKQRQNNIEFLKIGNINDRQADILSLIRDNPNTILTVKEVSNRQGVSHPTAKRDLDDLVDQRLLSRIAVNKVKSNYIKGDEYDEKIK